MFPLVGIPKTVAKFLKQYRLSYRQRTEIAVDLVRQLESEGQFPNADYAFEQGV